MRFVLYLWFIIVLLGTISVQCPASSAPEKRPADAKGIMTYTLSNGIIIRAQPRFNLNYARASIYLPVKRHLQSDGLRASRWLSVLYLDTAKDDGETPRQIMATLDAQMSVGYDERFISFNLLCLTERLPRALTTFLDILAENRICEPYWSKAMMRAQGEAEAVLVFGWEKARRNIQTALLTGRSLPDAMALTTEPVMELERLLVFRNQLMDPKSIRIIISGRGDVAETARQVAAHTSKWKSPAELEMSRGSPQSAPFYEFAEWSLPVSPSRVVFYLKGPGETSRRLPAFLTACSMLADGMTSMVGRRLTEGENPSPIVTLTHFDPGLKRSIFTLEIQAPVDRFDDVELQFFTAAAMMQRGKWFEVDLERGRNQAFVHAAKSIGTLSAFHRRILYTGKPVEKDFFTSWKRALKQVKKNDIIQTAKNAVTLSRTTILELPGSESKPRGFTSETFRDTIQSLIPIAVDKALRKFKEIPDIPLPVPEEDPFPQQTPEYIETEVESGILRGPRVLIAEKHTLPLVWIVVSYAGGRLIEPRNMAGINRLAILQRFQSCRDRQDRLLIEKLEMLGGRIRIVTDFESSGVELICPAYFRQEITALLFKILHRHRPNKEDLSKVLSWIELWGKGNQLPPSQRVLNQANASFYGLGNPFGRLPGEPMKVDTDIIARHYSQYFYHILPYIALVGNFDGTGLLPPISKSVSGSIFKKAEIPLLRPIFPTGKIPEKSEEGQQLADLVFPGPYGGDNDLIRFEVLRRLYLSDYLEKELSHQGWVKVLPLLSRGSIHIQFINDGEELCRTLQSFLTWLKDISHQSINSWKMAAAIKMAHLNHVVKTTDPIFQGRWMVKNALWNSPFWKVERYLNVLKQVRKDQIRDMLERYFTSGRYTIAVIPFSPSIDKHSPGTQKTVPESSDSNSESQN